MAAIDSEVWIPTPGSPTYTTTIGAGVSGYLAMQITNNTLGELWVNDSGTPPASPESAKYVVPPRATAVLPLGSSQVALRWNSLASGTSDLVSMIFSDDQVSPNVIPGVNSVGGSAAPVIAFQATISDLGGSWPKLLTTTSGKNVGNVWVYNNSALLWRVQFSIPSFRRVFIRPYSWICIPCNQPSGSIDVGPQGSLITGLFATDSVYVAFSDVDYVLPFPTGAGVLPDPITSLGASRAGAEPATIQLASQAGTAGVGPLTMYTLTPNVGAVQRIVLTHIDAAVTAGAAPANCAVQLTRGYDGLGAAVNLVIAIADTNRQDRVIRSDPVVVSNLNPVNSNVIRIIGAGTAIRVDGGIGGRILV